MGPAGAPDTKEIALEVSSAVARLQETRDGVVWIEKMLRELIAVIDACTVFVCPYRATRYRQPRGGGSPLLPRRDSRSCRW